MTTVFKKPPLLELMAEVRWGEPTLGVAAGAQAAFSMPPIIGRDGTPQPIHLAFSSSFDAFFMRFAVEAHNLGFTVQERIVPPNAVTAPYQAVWRWKKKDTPGLFLQLGSNSFTVNGGPPGYTHWDAFVPTVRQAIEGLLASLEALPNGPPQSFGEILLRYIDLFDSEDAKKFAPLDFLREVMGLNIQLPAAISGLENVVAPMVPKLDLSIPMKDGSMLLTFAEGIAAGRQGHIFDTTVARNAEIALTADAVVESFTAAHKITNSVFMALTKPLHDSMEPIK